MIGRPVKHPCITCGAPRNRHPVKNKLPPDGAETTICEQFLKARACKPECGKGANHRWRCDSAQAKVDKAIADHEKEMAAFLEERGACVDPVAPEAAPITGSE